METTQYPIGLKIPIKKGNLGYFEQNFNTMDQAYSNIKNLLLTSVGERRLNVGFGSLMQKFIFEQIQSTDDTSEKIQDHIRAIVNLYFPYVEVLSVDVSFVDVQYNKMSVNLKFRLKNSSANMFGVSESKEINLILGM